MILNRKISTLQSIVITSFNIITSFTTLKRSTMRTIINISSFITITHMTTTNTSTTQESWKNTQMFTIIRFPKITLFSTYSFLLIISSAQITAVTLITNTFVLTVYTILTSSSSTMFSTAPNALTSSFRSICSTYTYKYTSFRFFSKGVSNIYTFYTVLYK